MKYQGIIFDFNGVLLWDAELQARAWQVMAVRLRGCEMTEDELAIHMHGRPNAYVISYLLGHEVGGAELGDLIRAKESFYRHLCLENPHQFVLSPGSRDLLDVLVEHKIPRTIATSSEITNLKFFTQHLNLDRWFEVGKIVYDDGIRPGKPAPDVYLAAAESLQIVPNECVVVEDAISGVQAARAAGIGCIIGIGPSATHPRLRIHEGVFVVIESLAQFPRRILLE